jgi:hypothetical protein
MLHSGLIAVNEQIATWYSSGEDISHHPLWATSDQGDNQKQRSAATYEQLAWQRSKRPQDFPWDGRKAEKQELILSALILPGCSKTHEGNCSEFKSLRPISVKGRVMRQGSLRAQGTATPTSTHVSFLVHSTYFRRHALILYPVSIKPSGYNYGEQNVIFAVYVIFYSSHVGVHEHPIPGTPAVKSEFYDITACYLTNYRY